jgi:hypothetical protein
MDLMHIRYWIETRAFTPSLICDGGRSADLPLTTFGSCFPKEQGRGVLMATGETRTHLPSAIRYAARLQERTASCLQADGKQVVFLTQDARNLRVAAELLRQGVPLSRQHFPFKKSCFAL